MKATIDSNDLRVFAAVVAGGSFTVAADQLSSNKAHVSRVVSRLEKRLGAQLLQRSTRRLSLTEIGRDFFERAAAIIEALEETEASVARFKGEPLGELRLAAGAEFGQLRVNRWVVAYLQRYPLVRVHADYTNRVADIIHEGIDVAVRVGDLPDSGLSARKLGSIDYRFFAHPSYLEKAGKPDSPAALVDHALIHFGTANQTTWEITDGTVTRHLSAQPRLHVNNNLAAVDVAAAGLGIALLPVFQARLKSGPEALTQILPQWWRPPVPVHAVFASSRYMAPKVRAFVDIAVAMFDS